ncbi:hypothetical protein F-S17_0001 [Faustovirus]|nr:hypothetical protein F-S17_0001 [Faustovirus]SMH63444.1 Hypothetical protein FSTVLC9_409 [Faustovirus]
MQKFDFITDSRKWILGNPSAKYRKNIYWHYDGEKYLETFATTPGWKPRDGNALDWRFERNIVRCGRAECKNTGIMICCCVIYCCAKANDAKCLLCDTNLSDYVCVKCSSFCLNYNVMQIVPGYTFDKCKSCDRMECRYCHDRGNCDKAFRESKILNTQITFDNKVFPIVKRIGDIIVCRGGIFTRENNNIVSLTINDARITPTILRELCPLNLSRGRPTSTEVCTKSALETLFPNFEFVKVNPIWFTPNRNENKTGKTLEIDFICFDIPLAIEYNGKHHYEDLFKTPYEFERKQQNDRFKVETMARLGFKLIVIPWIHADERSIYDYLVGELDKLNIEYNKNYGFNNNTLDPDEIARRRAESDRIYAEMPKETLQNLYWDIEINNNWTLWN